MLIKSRTPSRDRNPSRRALLRALGVSAAAAPFVPVLERHAEAADPPRRLLLVWSPNGTVWDSYWPTGGDGNATFAPGSITEALAPLKAKVIFPKGLSRLRNGSGGHEQWFIPQWTGASATAQGYPNGPSVDQIIAKRVGGATTFPSLQFGVEHTLLGENAKLLCQITYSGANQPLPPESNPYRMFNRLMLGGSSIDFSTLRARRQSTIDLVNGELASLKPKLGHDDVVKIDQHLAGIQEIEKRLSAAMQASGSPKTCAQSPAAFKPGLDVKANDNFPELLKMQNANLVAAFACDLTRVASMQYSREACDLRLDWSGSKGPHHGISHQTDATNKGYMAKIDAWYHKQHAALLQAMDAIPEGNGTLLDNTMVIYCNNLTDGAAHSCAQGAATFIAGRGGGKLRTNAGGRLLSTTGYDFSQVLVTACHVMGLQDVDRIGDLGKQGDVPSLLA